MLIISRHINFVNSICHISKHNEGLSRLSTHWIIHQQESNFR